MRCEAVETSVFDGDYLKWDLVAHIGRASALQAEDCRFESGRFHTCRCSSGLVERESEVLGAAGSNPATDTTYGAVAQSVEQQIEALCVGGSIPSCVTYEMGKHEET